MTSAKDQAILGGGCFWCLEAVFNQIKGVESCTSGYSGGPDADPSPTYEKVCTGRSGHTEVVRVVFNPDEISFRKILAIFFAIHDPTTPDRQGNDVGPQYRSAIFYCNEEQKVQSEQFISDLQARNIYKAPVVTAIEPLLKFFEAEPYHNNYFENNPRQPYCAYVVAPKVEKAEDLFGDLFKR